MGAWRTEDYNFDDDSLKANAEHKVNFGYGSADSSSDPPEVVYWRNELLTYAVVVQSGHHLAFQVPRASQLFFTTWIYGYDDESQAMETSTTYTKIAIIAGVIAGLCVLGGVTFFCGCCPDSKYNSDLDDAADVMS